MPELEIWLAKHDIQALYARLTSEGFVDTSTIEPQNVAFVQLFADVCFKESTSFQCDDSEKNFFERCLHTYVSRSDVAVALAMHFPFKIANGVALFKCKSVRLPSDRTLNGLLDLRIQKIQFQKT
jgi:hypothetical protein